MTTPDAHGLLRERIAYHLTKVHGCRPQCADHLMPIVEAAIAAARRDAINEAAVMYGDPEPMLTFTAEQMAEWDAQRVAELQANSNSELELELEQRVAAERKQAAAQALRDTADYIEATWSDTETTELGAMALWLRCRASDLAADGSAVIEIEYPCCECCTATERHDHWEPCHLHSGEVTDER